jgi:hypothetical protein
VAAGETVPVLVSMPLFTKLPVFTAQVPVVCTTAFLPMVTDDVLESALSPMATPSACVRPLAVTVPPLMVMAPPV